MTIANILNADLSIAFIAGEAAAKLDLTHGNIFRSAVRAMNDAGYLRDTEEGRAFVQAYLSECPKCVHLDKEGRTLGEGADLLESMKTRVIGRGKLDL